MAEVGYSNLRTIRTNNQEPDMAKKETAAAAAAAQQEAQQEAPKGQGRAVTLPNGQRRIDYIRDEYYQKGTSRADIKNNINKMLEEAGRKNEQIPYQIVFAATKEGKQGDPSTDPRNKPKGAPSAAEGGE